MNVFIVGGSKGIGLSLALKCVENGDQVYVLARSRGELPKLDKLKYIEGDARKLTDEMIQSLPEAIDAYAYMPGSIDLKPFKRFSDKDFHEAFDLNVLANIRILQKITPRLQASGSASCVSFSTVASKLGMNFHSLVATVKSANEGLMKSLAAELAPKIRFNVIAPSLTNTPLAEKLFKNEKLTESSAEKHAMKRLGEPKDIAAMAYFLMSKESAWVTGQVMHVDGGLSTLEV